MESTYLLFRATRNPFYLHVGQDILESLDKHAKSECGYATIHDVYDMSLGKKVADSMVFFRMATFGVAGEMKCMSKSYNFIHELPNFLAQHKKGRQ